MSVVVVATARVSPGEEVTMLLLRNASGAFIRVDSIVALSPRRAGDGQITWAAVRPDGSQVELASFYSMPGRIEKALPHLMSSGSDAI